MASERHQRRSERFLDEAEEAVSQLDWSTVSERAQAVLAFDPKNADALDLLTVARTAPIPRPDHSFLISNSHFYSTTHGPTFFATAGYEARRFLRAGGISSMLSVLGLCVIVRPITYKPAIGPRTISNGQSRVKHGNLSLQEVTEWIVETPPGF